MKAGSCKWRRAIPQSYNLLYHLGPESVFLRKKVISELFLVLTFHYEADEKVETHLKVSLRRAFCLQHDVKWSPVKDTWKIECLFFFCFFFKSVCSCSSRLMGCSVAWESVHICFSFFFFFLLYNSAQVWVSLFSVLFWSRVEVVTAWESDERMCQHCQFLECVAILPVLTYSKKHHDMLELSI